MDNNYRTDTPYWYGLRHGSNQPKASGFYGPVPVPGGVATEYAIDVDINGRPVQIPTMVPGLTASEMQALLRAAGSEGGYLPDSIIDKAVAHARARMAQGQPPFWRMPEKQHPLPKGLLDIE